MATKTRRLADFLANIDDDSRVTSAGLLDATITAADLANDSVGAAEIIDDAVTNAAIADGAIDTAAKLGSNVVTSSAILDANITAAKLSSTALASVEHVKPHIQPGKLYPALHGLIDGDVHHIVDSSASARSILENNKEAVNTYARGIYHSSANKNTNHALKSAIDFDGGYTTLEIDGHADFNLGSGNFTIEMWAKFHDPTETTHSLINLWVDANNRWQLTNYGSLAFYSNIGGSSNDVSASRTKDANWHHYAIVREGTGSNQTKIYLDGAVHAQGANALNLNFNGTKLYLGTRTDNGSDFTTYSAPISMNMIRVVKGKAVYTGAFAPPTALTTTGGTYSSATNVVNPTSGETKLLINSDNSSHSGAYGTAQSDSKKYYYTDIKGSSPINDPRIGAHYGSHRHMTKSVQLLKRESGANSRKIYSVDGREWCRGALSGVSYGADSAEVIYYGNGDYMEITGYFSDAQIQFHNIASRHINYTLDGVNNSTNFASASVTTPQAGRYVPAGGVQNLGLGATLGIHTLKLRHVTAGASNFQVSFELFVQDTQDFTATNATNILTSVGHTLTNGDEIILTGSDLPNGLSAATKYYVIGVSGNNFQVATTSTGSAVAFSDDGSGTRTFTALNNVHIPAQDVISYGKKLSVSAAGHHYNPFAVAANGTTAVAIGDTTSHGKVATGWSGTTAGHFDSTLDVATSLGLDAWVTGGNYYRPVNGGRIVKWIDSTGAIKTSVNVVPPTANLDRRWSGTAAQTGGDAALPTSHAWTTVWNPKFSKKTMDFTLSEVSGRFNIHEFGNGAANEKSNTAGAKQDFSMLSTSMFPNVAYVMDDGLTGACAVDINQSTNGIGIGNSNGDYMVMTFIGTGVTYTSAHTAQPGPWDVATNLPYGSHTFMITRDTDASDTGKMRLDGVELWDQPSGKYGMRYPEDISFLQPKMPPIPENAVVIADYMLMADFVKQANSNDTSISKGVRALSGSRDIYVSAASALAEVSNNEINYLPYGIEAYASPGGSGHTGDGEIAWFGTQAVSLLQNHASAHIIQLNGSTVATSAIDSSRNDKSDGRTLNAPAAILGTNKIKTKMLVGGYGFQGYYLQTPIHTSSHYQLFEAPYLKELVGGDRNMEQTNLVVTADGKTWDQLTRDTSYIGNVCIFTTNDENISNGSSVQMFDEWRGTYQNHKMWLNKDFAINYDKTICLVEGWYEIRTQTLRKGAHGHCNIKINGTAVLYGHGGSSNHDTPNTTLTVFLKRGDTIQIFGSWYQDKLFSHHQITRIPQG